MGWAVRHLADAGVKLPSDWAVASILQLVLDVWHHAREIYGKIRVHAVAMIGERNVAFIEKVVSLLVTLVKQGPGAALEQAAVDVLAKPMCESSRRSAAWSTRLFTPGRKRSGSRPRVFSNLKDELLNSRPGMGGDRRHQGRGWMKLATMFQPGGRHHSGHHHDLQHRDVPHRAHQQILDFVEADVNSVYKIATGDIGAAANWDRTGAARTNPAHHQLLARLLA